MAPQWTGMNTQQSGHVQQYPPLPNFIKIQKSPIVQHWEIQPLFSNHFKWNIIHKNIEQCCTPEKTNTVNQLYFNEKKRKKP